MMKKLRLIVAICSSLLLSGCFCMGCFVSQLPPPPKPQRDYWVKNSMNENDRKTDWVECGGDTLGSFSMHIGRMLPGETKDASRLRQSSELKACMSQRGYSYKTDRKDEKNSKKNGLGS